MEAFQCPYLGGAVELSDDRERHITYRHADLLPYLLEYVAGTLASPDLILRKRPTDNDIQFYRWYYGNWNKYVVVVVVKDPGRNWIITAFPSDRVPRGELLWQRS